MNVVDRRDSIYVNVTDMSRRLDGHVMLLILLRDQHGVHIAFTTQQDQSGLGSQVVFVSEYSKSREWFIGLQICEVLNV